MATYSTQNFEDGNSAGLKDKLYLSERYIYGSSRLGLEQVDKLMAYKQDLSELDMSNVVQDYLAPLEIGTWRFTSSLGNHPTMYESLDFNNDAKMDMKVNSIAGSGSFSAHLMFMTVPGETYTLEYDILDINIPTLYGYRYNISSAGASVPNNETQSINVGHYTMNFTVPVNENPIMRLKFFAGNNSNAGGYFVVGNIKVTGAGNPFNKALAPALPVEQEELIVGDKRYELTDHRNNVYSVISDRKIPLNSSTYSADVIQFTDYSPFGVEQDQRHGVEDEDYRYSLSGKEKDEEIKGEGNSIDFGARMYDPRIARWSSMDGLFAKYPNLSPYNYTANNPIFFVDVDGNDIITIIQNTATTESKFIGTDRVMSTSSVATSYSIEITKADGPDVFIWRKTSEHITVTKTEETMYFEETAYSLAHVSDWKLFPDDGKSKSGLTRHVSQFCDGLFGFTVADYDDVTIGKFMLADEEFSKYMIERNSEAEKWKQRAILSHNLDGLSQIVRTVSFAYFGGVLSEISIAAKGSNLVKIGTIEDDVMIFSAKFGDETVEGVTNFSVKDGTLYLDKLHLATSQKNHPKIRFLFILRNTTNLRKSIRKFGRIKRMTIC